MTKKVTFAAQPEQVYLKLILRCSIFGLNDEWLSWQQKTVQQKLLAQSEWEKGGVTFSPLARTAQPHKE